MANPVKQLQRKQEEYQKLDRQDKRRRCQEIHSALAGEAPGIELPDHRGHGKARAHQLQRAVNIAGPLLQQGRKGQGGEDLQQKQQHA